IAALQREHMVASLSEQVMTELLSNGLGSQLDTPALIDVLDAFYSADAARARDDGYLRFAHPVSAASDARAALAAALPGLAVPHEAYVHSIDDLISLVNDALEAAGDPRRLYPLETGHEWQACYLLATDRAIRLAKVLPLA